MKKLTFLHLNLFVFLFFAVATAHAQNQPTFATLNPAKMKGVGTGSYAFNASPTEACLDHFHSAFPDATKVMWYTDNKGLPYVVFTRQGKADRVFFDRKGRICYSMSYYSEEMLPTQILQLVKNTYYDKSIFGVTEIFYNNATTYVIVLEDKTSWLEIKIADDEIKEQKAMMKVRS